MQCVEQLDVAALRVPLDEPESDGTLTWSDTTVVTVEAISQGVRGLGFTYAPPACAAFISDVLAPIARGGDAANPPRTWAAMVAQIRNFGRPGIVSSAIAAVDTALWDLKARLADEPLCETLGMAHDSVPIYGSGGFTSFTDAELEAQFGGWVHEQQIPRVKMKVAESWGTNQERDLERVSLARTTIGDRAELFVDANGGYSRKQAIRLAAEFADLGVTWFEEPVSSDDLAGLADIRRGVATEVAAGEYGYDLPYFERMCAAGAVDCLQADISRCAGITEWLRVADVAAAHGLEISGHCAPSLHLHPACAVSNLRHVEYFADHVRADRLLFDGVISPEPGGVLRPDRRRSGNGLTLKPEAARAFRVDD
jgi:L-alanine-DL-glutamate epimerase-like enolase superfamily enzyme